MTSGHTSQSRSGSLQAVPEPLVVSYARAAQLLDCSTKTIWRRLRAGDLKRVGSGRGTKVTMASIKRYLEEQGHGAHA